jgi:hypothetical protein
MPRPCWRCCARIHYDTAKQLGLEGIEPSPPHFASERRFNNDVACMIQHFSPCIARNVLVPKYHRCNSVPRLPRGSSMLCSGPAPNPSSESEKPATRTFVMTSAFSATPLFDAGTAPDHSIFSGSGNEVMNRSKSVRSPVSVNSPAASASTTGRPP